MLIQFAIFSIGILEIKIQTIDRMKLFPARTQLNLDFSYTSLKTSSQTGTFLYKNTFQINFVTAIPYLQGPQNQGRVGGVGGGEGRRR